MSKKKIIKDVLNYSATNYLANIFDFITGIVIRRILGPATMGIFVELMLLFDYGKNHDLGVLNALDREVPVLNGKKDYAGVKRVADVGLTACILTSGLLGLALVLYSLFMHKMHDPRFIIGMRIIAVLNIIQAFVSFYTVIIRTHHKFNILSKCIFIAGLANLVITFILLVKFNFYGLLVALVLVVLLRAVYLFAASGWRISFLVPLPLKEAKALIKIGFPILLSGFIFTILRSIDRFMIIAFLDKVDLGYYSIATMMHGYILQLPNLAYAVFFPHFYEAFGRTGDIYEIKKYYTFPTMTFACLFPIFIGIAVLTLPTVLHYLLPKYTLGLWPAIILMLGTFFMSVTYASGYLLTALNKQVYAVVAGICVVAFSLLFNFILLRVFKLGLIGVALATAVSYLLYSVFLIVLAFRNYTRRFREHAVFIFSLYAPFAWSVIVLAGISSIFGHVFISLKHDLFSLSLQLFIFTIACLPIFFYLNKKTTILNTVFVMVKERLNWR